MTEETPIETPIEPPVTLDFSGTEIEFSTLEELEAFAQKERAEWAWLEKVTGRYLYLGPVFGSFIELYMYFDHFVHESRQYQNNEKKLNNLVNNLRNQVNMANSKGFRLTQSPEAQFVFTLRDNKSPVIAAYALAILNNINIKLDTPVAYEGAFWAMQYKQGSQQTIEAHQKALESMKNDWADIFSKQHKELNGLKKQSNTLVEEFDNTKNKQQNEFAEILQETRSKLADIERTYDEKLALQSSVQYWRDKRTRHQKAMWWLGGVTVLSAALTGSGFIWAAYELLKETVSQVPLWKLGVMLAISTFGIWLTRLSAKIFISNLHLHTDANERVTMIQTYLALLREGSGPKEDERQLILQTLFRPGSTGFIKEDGPYGFHETISKTMKR